MLLLLIALLFPAVLLGLMITMERVEKPLRSESVGDHLAEFLDTARPEEVERYVSRGLAPALDRYWSRRAMRARRLSRRLGRVW